MKKYDKEYSTQYSPEKEYLLQQGISPSFVKVIEGVTTYKYTKTAKLFRALAFFYSVDNIREIKNGDMDKRKRATFS